MKQADKTYPIDISGVKKIGVERWLKEYYIPVTGKEYYTIYMNIYKLYLSILKETDNRLVYYIGGANIYITLILADYILNSIRLKQLKKQGYNYIVDSKSVKLTDSFSPYSLEALSYLESIVNTLESASLTGKTKEFMRMVKYNLGLLNINNSRNFIKNISNPYFLVGYKLQQEVDCFCRENHIFPVQIPHLLFMDGKGKRYDAERQFIEVESFILSFLNLIDREFSIFSDESGELLKEKIINNFYYCFLYFIQNVSILNKLPRSTLLVTGPGSLFNRLFSAAWRYNGGDVTGFVHGNSYCYNYTPLVINDLLIVDHYVVTSQGEKRIITEANEKFSDGLKLPKISSLKHNIYYPLFKELQNSDRVMKVNNLMLVGSVTKSYFPRDGEYHTFAFLHHDIQILKLAKKNNYHVIYKPRLDTLKETTGIFESYSDEVLLERFEDVYQKADCLIFSSPYSTTFGFSLLTNKPIVVFNVKGYYWYPHALELLKKRCCFVEAYPENGKICFDEEEFINAVEASVNNISYDILYEFAF